MPRYPLLALPVLALMLAACAQPAAPAAKPSAPAAAAPTTAAAPQASAPTSAAAPPARVKVRMGKLPTVSDSGMHLAVEKGYFAEEGLDIESIPFDSAAQMVAPPGAGLYNAISRELPLKIVADKGSFPPGAGWLTLIVRPDLADQIRDYGDLRGRKIAINQFGTTNDIAIETALKKGGATLQDVELVQLPFADMNTALANRNVDVALQNEPFLATAVEQGIGVKFHSIDEFYPY